MPKDGNVSLLPTTDWGTVVPQNQSLIYAFDSTGVERNNQDVGYDGYDDSEETPTFTDPDKLFLNTIYDNFRGIEDPANDNYQFFLNADGNIFDRYKKYNGVEGNTPDTFTDTQRGTNTQPDVEDINRDNTMNTIDSYFEYELEITPSTLNIDNEFIVDTKNVEEVTGQNRRILPNGETVDPKWYFRF